MSPLLISGLVLALLGLLFGRVFVANFELSTRGKVVKTVGVLAVVIGALLALRGAELIGSAAPTDTTGGTTWGDDPVAAEADARARKLPLLVDFSADWCKACKELEVLTFSSPEISERLKGWVTARVDLTHDRPELADLQKRFKVQGLPTVAFVTPDGKVLDALTLTGFEDAAAFGKRLDQAESGGAGIAVDRPAWRRRPGGCRGLGRRHSTTGQHSYNDCCANLRQECTHGSDFARSPRRRDAAGADRLVDDVLRAQARGIAGRAAA